MRRTAGRRTSLPDGKRQTGVSSHKASAQTSAVGNTILIRNLLQQAVLLLENIYYMYNLLTVS